MQDNVDSACSHLFSPEILKLFRIVLIIFSDPDKFFTAFVCLNLWSLIYCMSQLSSFIGISFLKLFLSILYQSSPTEVDTFPPTLPFLSPIFFVCFFQCLYLIFYLIFKLCLGHRSVKAGFNFVSSQLEKKEKE